MHVVAPRTVGGPSSGPRLHQPVSALLATEFFNVPGDVIDRCVSDVWACAEHLGVEVTPALVERIAREHLLAMVNSSPPSRR